MTAPHLRSMFRNAVSLGITIAALGLPARAWGQACCAGAGAITPARLALHEDVLLGVQARAANLIGSFDNQRSYASSPSGTSEFDFEQDLFGAVRIFRRGQFALLVPVVETRRQTRGTSEFGGGIGDVNASARYDFFLAGQSQYVPGVAVLAGLTMPSGRPPESASRPLATDSTGIGAFQGNIGLAAEQSYGHWLFNVTGLLSKRAARSVQGVSETLGTQATILVASGYTFDNDAAVALLASYTFEGQAVINGADVSSSARALSLVSLSGLWPLSDAWRLQGSLFLNPPLGHLGRNQPATAGFTFGVVRSWS